MFIKAFMDSWRNEINNAYPTNKRQITKENIICP